MTQGGDASGYTIVEAMIFFAVTGVLFISALNLIRGRQETVQFSQATRDAQSKVQDIINQVSNGFFPKKTDFTCSVPGGAGGRPTFLAGTEQQGTSDTCVFLGKVIQFGVGAEGDEYNVISVASRRKSESGQEVNSLDQARATAIAPTAPLDTSKPDVTDKLVFQYGLKVTRVTIPEPTAGTYQGTSYGAVGFFGTFPNVVLSDPTKLASGAQRVSFGVIPGTSLGQTVYGAVGAVNTITSANTTLSPDPLLAKGIVICLENQGGARKAKLTIGGVVSDTSVKLEIGSFTICTA